ncbi:YVTN family beta-propeller protein [Pseudochelatococcus lubricantis]|uniref:YVTN family beta-propeller protein n=1 Tax=Pseudochelatococcus lubricantis TaxID=1538102 RepID=A0ABX0UWF6_9HYPH|nr:YncE family protein [Pseudochelatococcus lubricantis]NIJ57087.1 YVTN family beta-propeller protein [Pseudochelatococcus lubricantis]
MTPRISYVKHRCKLPVLALALVVLVPAGGFAQNAVFDAPDADFKGRVSAGGVVTPGSAAILRGSSFKPGQTVILSRGNTILNPEGKPLTVDDKGGFELKIDVPADAVPGQHPIIVNVANPTAAAVAQLKVSPVIPASGADKFTAVSEKVVPGLYQVAYSPKSNALFVTSAVGRPPVKESKLVKLNAGTLAKEAEVDAKPVAGRSDGHLHAVYGVGVDDVEGNVWTTTTRDGSVAVFRQSDLSLVKQFEADAVPHSRDVVVDAEQGRAYASAVGGNFVVVFDTKKLEKLQNIEIESKVRGEKFTPTALALDAGNRKLYTVSLSTAEAAVIDTKTNTVDKVLPLPGAKSSIGVAVDAAGKQLYVVSQGSDNLLIIDIETGKVLHDVKTGAGPLNVAFDPVSKLAYVVNRGAGTVTVVNPQGEIVANLEGGTFPNHVAADGKGHVFVINKARGEDDPTGDRLTRLTPKS